MSASPTPRTLFLPITWLGLVFVAGKISCVWPKADDVGLLALSAEDMTVLALFSVVAAVALRMTSGRPALTRIAWSAIALIGAVAAFHAVVNVGVYRAIRQPLNLRMLQLVRLAGNMRSSLGAHSDPPVVAGLFVAPLSFLAALWWQPVWARGRRLEWAAIAMVVLWAVAGLPLRASVDPNGWFGRAVENPHRVMIESVLSEWLGRHPAVDTAFPAEYLADFAPAQTRPRPALPAWSPAPRNVIVVVLESTGATYLSLYGAPFDTTPRLLAESRHAMVFDRFYAHVGYTFCAMMPIVYAVYPGLPWSYRPDGARPLPTALPSLMRQRGYRTAFISSADAQWGGMDAMAHDAGLDDVLGPAELGGAASSAWGTDDGALVDGLLAWIDKEPQRPFFAIAWTNQAHDPYLLAKDTSPARFVDAGQLPRADDLNRYLTALRQVDAQLGRLFDGLRDRRLADDTLVVLVGDHGEAFGETHEATGHGGSVYEESLRVPLVFWNPRLIRAPARVHTVGGQVDLQPTLAHILGVDVPPDWQGASLFSREHLNRAYLMADMSGVEFSVTDERFKYVLDVSRGFERLYDLRDDPLEQRDVAAQHPDRTAELRARVSAFVHAEQRYVDGSHGEGAQQGRGPS